MNGRPFDWQSQISEEELNERPDVHTGDDVPTPAQLNAQYLNSSGGMAVSGQPTDEHPGDVDRARQRIEWDADTDVFTLDDHG